jgi:hypothetical protein
MISARSVARSSRRSGFALRKAENGSVGELHGALGQRQDQAGVRLGRGAHAREQEGAPAVAHLVQVAVVRADLAVSERKRADGPGSDHLPHRRQHFAGHGKIVHGGDAVEQVPDIGITEFVRPAQARRAQMGVEIVQARQERHAAAHHDPGPARRAQARPTAAIRSPEISTSAGAAGAPVPSNTSAPRMRMAPSGCAAAKHRRASKMAASLPNVMGERRGEGASSMLVLSPRLDPSKIAA